MQKSTLAYSTALTGYFGLFISLILWGAWLNSEPSLPRSLTLLLTVGPLMFPLRGLLHGKAYTFGWSTFLALFYLMLGVLNAANPGTRFIGVVEIIFSILFFVGTVVYVRLQRGSKQEISG